MTLQPLDLDPRYPTPAMSHWHAQRLLRRASWQRLALPAPAKVAAGEPPQAVPAPVCAFDLLVRDPLAAQFRAAHKMLRIAAGPRIRAIQRIVAVHYGLRVSN